MKALCLIALLAFGTLVGTSGALADVITTKASIEMGDLTYEAVSCDVVTTFSMVADRTMTCHFSGDIELAFAEVSENVVAHFGESDSGEIPSFRENWRPRSHDATYCESNPTSLNSYRHARDGLSCAGRLQSLA